MVEYKIISKGNVRIRSLNKRFKVDETMFINNPSSNIVKEIIRCKNIGLIELHELEMDPHNKSKEGDKPMPLPKNDLVKTNLYDESKKGVEPITLPKNVLVETNLYDEKLKEEDNNDKFYCPIHGRNHYKDSKVGKECLSKINNK